MHLPIDEVSSDQDFFDMGGDSLKAIAFINAARRSGVDLSISQLYEKRTLAGLAGLELDGITTKQSIPSPFSLCPSNEVSNLKSAALDQLLVAAEEIEDIMPILDLPAWYLSYQKENPRSFQIPFAFRLPNDINVEKLKRAWEGMVQIHPMLRTRFIFVAKYWQVVLTRSEVQWRPEKRLPDFMRAIRSVLLHNGSQQCGIVTSGHGMFLIWYAHHALSDQMMTELMIDDVWTLYHGGKVPYRNPYSGLIQHRLKQTPEWQNLRGGTYAPLVPCPHGAKVLATSRMSFDVTLGEDWLGGRGYAMILAAWATAFRELNGAKDHGFFILKNGRGPQYAGSEAIVGPLFERVPVRVSLQDGLVDLEGITRAIKGQGIVDERSLSEDIMANGIFVNFATGATGELVDRGMGTHPLIFRIVAEVRGGDAAMFVTFDEAWLERSLVQRLVRLFAGGLEKLQNGLKLDGSEMSVEMMYEKQLV